MIDQAMCDRIDGTPRSLLIQWIETLRAEVLALRKELDVVTRPLEQDLADITHARALRRMLELERRQIEAIRILEGGR